ncbi:FAD-dependent oxidoreductase [Flavobacterium hydatis]|uniref:Flavin-dependent monooxygenase n=1 Tax=Flavobacterium hydatis TaxID=991 RepID=A0A086AGL9_FLAHY|nr:NAD(P)/FAD-dependent oxidoreductase [Flavobacterium hydatis]KFF15833.1 2-polyprenyl-6-methoxyphenol hydroxylase [Flavobacterium hydatis]OXA92333.1 2-polyprenyl-6-methoxyphenol hydroxylase [Flavobacterium hydatis]
MLIKNKKIAIVGGGPGGLTLARLLQLKGAEVKVYERDFNSEVRVQGATLDLHEESGLEALRRAGLIDAFYANHRPEAGKLRILDKNLNIAMDTHSADDYEENRPEIDRGPLRNILLDSLQPETVVWDSQFLSISPKNEGWELTFKNESKAEADIVIAADGANSKIRPRINSIKPIYSGVTIVEGNVYNAEKNAPKLYELVNGGKVFAFGDEKTLILSMKGDGTLSFYTGCKADEFWVRDSNIDFSNKEQVFEWFKSEFGSWDPIWQELFNSDDMSIIPRPQYHFPLDQQWDALPNLTMLGDAAHRMPPYAGEGVNMAMQDAFELAEALSDDNFPDVQTAIATYEKQMCKRASEITKITLDSTEMMHSNDPITKLINMFNGVDEVEH